VTVPLQALSLVGKAEPVRVSLLHTTLQGLTGVCECEMDGKVGMDSYMASNRSCFMVTWISFEKHFLEVGRSEHKTGRSWHTGCSQPPVYSILSCVRACMNRNSLK
jgi:hypothetical protein